MHKVYIEGNAISSSKAILGALPALKEGRSVNISGLSRQVMLANENTFRKMSVNLRPAGDNQVDAYVVVTEKPSSKFILSVDNTGDQYTGQLRANLSYLNGNVGGTGQTAVLSFTTSPDHFSDVKQFGFLYNAPQPGSGDNIYFTASYSDVNSGRILSSQGFSLDAAGKGSALGLYYVKNMYRTENVKESLALGLNYNQYKNDTTMVFLGEPIQLGVDIDSMPLNLTYQRSNISPASKDSVSYSVSLIHNLPGGGKNSDRQYDMYRPGTKADYDVWRASFNHQHMFKSNWISNIALNGQYANQRLIYPEQMGLGGMYSIRGLDERDVAGDKAIRASLELYTPEVFSKGQRFLVFLDTGRFSNVSPQPGELTSGTAVSTGVGWRLNSRGYSLAANWGYMLDGMVESEKHKSKFHFLASKVF